MRYKRSGTVLLDLFFFVPMASTWNLCLFRHIASTYPPHSHLLLRVAIHPNIPSNGAPLVKFGSNLPTYLTVISSTKLLFPDMRSDGALIFHLSAAASASTISAGGFHTCALLRGGDVLCWGSTGLGAADDLTPVKVDLGTAARVPDVALS